jgi:hypothetical protein
MIGTLGDRDVWAMTGNMGQLVFAVADATGASPSMDTLLTVLADVTSTVIISDDNSGFGFASAVAGMALSMSGRVYFVVDEVGANSTISRYGLHAAIIPETNVAAEVEGNNLYTQANSIIRAYMTGTVPGGDPVDYFKFPATAGDWIAVIVDEDPDKDGARFDSTLKLVSTDGVSALGLGDDNSAFPANATAPITAPATGMYYEHRRWISQQHRKDYRLVVLVNRQPSRNQAVFQRSCG